MTAFLLTAAVLSLVFALYLPRDQRQPVTLISPGSTPKPVYNPYRREIASASQSAPPAEAAPAQPQAAAQPGSTIGYRPCMREDIFPRSEGYDAGNAFTGPTVGL